MTTCTICEAEIPDGAQHEIADHPFCNACWHLFFEEHDQTQEPITEVEGGAA